MREITTMSLFSCASPRSDKTCKGAKDCAPSALTAKARRMQSLLVRTENHLPCLGTTPICNRWTNFLGTWLEFKGAAGVPVRCALAAKIDSIDKLFFVNSKGIKVVELTRMRLARELKAGSVKIVSEGSLVDRAMESVINNLRDTAQVQEPDAAAN
ncbi:MAG: DUF1631 family protein [Gammaproteobacteria bacterium]|jgi:hypothetical protein|nr:DUF1631 family protein [Gammaproteobacteria bacterium]